MKVLATKNEVMSFFRGFISRYKICSMLQISALHEVRNKKYLIIAREN
jgi:hypothetical protein